MALTRLNGLVSVMALAVAQKRGPLARKLEAELSVAEDIEDMDGLTMVKSTYKCVLHSGMLFCFKEDPGELVDCFPLSLCNISNGGRDDADRADQARTETCSLSLRSASTDTMLITLFFKSNAIMRVWEEAMMAASSMAVVARSRSTPTVSSRTLHAGQTQPNNETDNSHIPSHRQWAKSSPRSLPPHSSSISELDPLDVSSSVTALSSAREKILQHSQEVSVRQGAFMQRLEAQSHVFGAEVNWRRLKLVDPTPSPTSGQNVEGPASPRKQTRHGFDPVHHTRASAAERKAVAKDRSFFSSLKYHPKLRELVLGDDSPQFQKHIAALQEQVRGVKHNSRKLLQSASNYFSTGKAFCAAGHDFAQDMIRYAPYQRTEWELGKGVLSNSATGATGLRAKDEQKLSKDLGEDTARTRKLAVLTEELTLLIREAVIHLEVGLSQQEEALIKPLEHLIQVEAKACKLSMERYEREKKLYLAALSKFQGLNVKRGTAKGAARKEALQQEAAMHSKIFEDARFEAALKLGFFDAVRDTRYLEQITQWLHVQLSYFTYGERLLGERGSYLVDMYSRLAASNESTVTATHTLRSEYENWKLNNLNSADASVAGSTIRSMQAGVSFHDGAEDDIFSDDEAGEGRSSPGAKNKMMADRRHAGGRHGRGESFYEGYLMIRSKRWKGKWKRRWFTCDGKQFYYCKTAEQDAVRANEVDLTMASIRPARDVDRAHCFEVVTSKPGGGMLIMCLQAASADEMQSWMQAITAGISAQLDALAPSTVQATKGADSASGRNKSRNPAEDQKRKKEKEAQRQRQLQMILAAPGNTTCADCGGNYNLEWCSLNLGVVLCLECAGVHRSLGVHISQCRSFNLDVLDESILSMFGAIGNTLANSVWEEELEKGSKPQPKSTREVKEAYIKKKYVERAMIGEGSRADAAVRCADLIDAAAHGDMRRLILHVACKTDLDFVSEHGATALSAAAHRGHPGPITLLLLNHANVNKCGSAGWSPLHAAAYGGKKEAVRLLMAKGGNELAKEQHGQTPIDIAVRCGHETCVILMGGVFPASKRGLPRPEKRTFVSKSVAPTPAGAAGVNVFDDDYNVDSTTVSSDPNNSPPAWKDAARRSSSRRENSKKNQLSSNDLSSNAGSSSSAFSPEPRRMWTSGDVVNAMYGFVPESVNELALETGQQYIVLKKESSTGWTFVQNSAGQKGLVPSTYIALAQ